MPALVGLALLALAGALLWWPRWRWRRALARPFAPAWLDILERNVLLYGRLAPHQQAQLRRHVQQFLHEKRFVGCAGLDITDEMRVTIAAQAGLLMLGRTPGPRRLYRQLELVLVYPSAFLVPRQEVDAAGVITHSQQGLLGESWSDGRVVLAWDHVLQGGREQGGGHNVVLHEFAHQLDSEAGSNNGAPWLGQAAKYRRWSEVFARHFAELQYAAMAELPAVLDHYGASSPAEFFAVATEAFFLTPWPMAERHPELYEQLLDYYQVNPTSWYPPPAPHRTDNQVSPAPEYWFGQAVSPVAAGGSTLDR